MKVLEMCISFPGSSQDVGFGALRIRVISQVLR